MQQLNVRLMPYRLHRNGLPIGDIMKNQYEREKVVKPCLNRCDWLLRQGHILEYKRLETCDFQHNKGSPDIEIRFEHQGMCWILMCEAKKPDGTEKDLRSTQIKYRERYQMCTNVVYMVVTDVSQIESKLEEITGKFQKELDAIEF